MAVYEFESGALKERDRKAWEMVWDQSAAHGGIRKAMNHLGFNHYDEVKDVYEVYTRSPYAAASQLSVFAPYRVVFAMHFMENDLDMILCRGGLDDYLSVLHLLEPMVRRVEVRQAEIDAELALLGH